MKIAMRTRKEWMEQQKDCGLAWPFFCLGLEPTPLSLIQRGAPRAQRPVPFLGPLDLREVSFNHLLDKLCRRRRGKLCGEPALVEVVFHESQNFHLLVIHEAGHVPLSPHLPVAR
jgi:hypothetical protein